MAHGFGKLDAKSFTCIMVMLLSCISGEDIYSSFTSVNLSESNDRILVPKNLSKELFPTEIDAVVEISISNDQLQFGEICSSSSLVYPLALLSLNSKPIKNIENGFTPDIRNLYKKLRQHVQKYWQFPTKGRSRPTSKGGICMRILSTSIGKSKVYLKHLGLWKNKRKKPPARAGSWIYLGPDIEKIKYIFDQNGLMLRKFSKLDKNRSLARRSRSAGVPVSTFNDDKETTLLPLSTTISPEVDNGSKTSGNFTKQPPLGEVLVPVKTNKNENDENTGILLSDHFLEATNENGNVQGDDPVSLINKNENVLRELSDLNPNVPLSSQLSENINNKCVDVIRVYGMRPLTENFVYQDGSYRITANSEGHLQLYGNGFTKNMEVQFTGKKDEFGSLCDTRTSEIFKIEAIGVGWANVNVNLPVMSSEQECWHLCIRENNKSVAVHQGDADWLSVATYNRLLPLWIQILFLMVLLMLSGLFSGLNLGLMALDKTELKIVSNTGSPMERKYARAIEPVRRHGNFLLCTLLLGNVLVNSTLTIVLDMLSSGLIAVIGSTTGIVIFGEIIPQAICSRHGLAIGARTVWLVRIFMVLTGIISWPISKILDCVLGEELGNTYDRERLKELIRVTQGNNDIREEEQNIICGALELHKKTVVEIMTKLEDVYMLTSDAILDFNTINDIMQQGYSRIPVFEGERTTIISLMFIKDLAFIDPDDNTPLKTLIQFYKNPCNFVFEDTTLDVLFKEFKEGQKGHMAFIQRVNNEGEGDPFYEVIGLVTLEDIIEELIQEEIVDETDVFTDNRTRRRRKHIRPDFKEFSISNAAGQPQKKIVISPQMQVATLQYLRTSLDPFKEGQLSESMLKRILQQDIIHSYKPSNDKEVFCLYTQGKPADFFTLVLEGHVEVTIGRESLSFESGPFTYFGLSVLSGTPTVGESPSLNTQLSRNSIVGSIQSLDHSKLLFTPDYTVKPTGEITYLKIRRQHYVAARRVYMLEVSQRDPTPGDTFEQEMAKILKAEIISPTESDSPKPASSPGKRFSIKEDNSSPSKDISDSLDESLLKNHFSMHSVGRSSASRKNANVEKTSAASSPEEDKSISPIDSCSTTNLPE